MKNKITITIILSVLCAFTCFAVNDKKVEATVEENIVAVIKEVQGEVSGINRMFISVIYAQDEKASYEMALTVDKDTKVEGAKNSNLKGIKTGDIVSVKYEEKAGSEEGMVLTRIAKVVTLITAAPQVVETSE